MVDTQVIINKYIELLEANLEDPNSDRASKGKKWIYDDYPRSDITSYPRISITSPDEAIEILDIGYNKELVKTKIQVLILVNKGFKAIINNEQKRDREIAEYLAQQIQGIIRSNQEEFRNIGLLLASPDNASYTQTDKLYIKQLIFNNIYVR